MTNLVRMILVACACALVACGGDDGDGGSGAAAAPAPAPAATAAQTTTTPTPATTEAPAPAETTATVEAPPAETAPKAEAPKDEAPAADAGGDADRKEIVAVLTVYKTGMADKDFAAVCGTFTKKARDGLTEAAKQVNKDVTDCESAFGSLSGFLDEATRNTLRVATIADVKIEGDKAIARLSGTKQTTRLSKEDGEWRVELDQ